MNQQNNAPIDRGRVCFVVERYPDKTQQPVNGQHPLKNRYATIGRATKWPGENGSEPKIDCELDALPVGHVGTLKLYFFWDSENQNNQQSTNQNNNQPQYQNNQQQGQYQNNNQNNYQGQRG